MDLTERSAFAVAHLGALSSQHALVRRECRRSLARLHQSLAELEGFRSALHRALRDIEHDTHRLNVRNLSFRERAGGGFGRPDASEER